MDLKELHSKFADKDSPSVEGQIRWLQKQGFAKHQIEQAIVMVYSDIERGQIPQVYSRTIQQTDGSYTDSKIYRLKDDSGGLDSAYKARDISSGWELDHVLLELAKKLRTNELTAQLEQIQQWEEKMRKKWEAGQKKGFWRRLFGS